MSERRLEVVLAWHMHQPDFRDQASGDFTHPWVYLHAIKDYTDMAWHLERHPGVRAVVNLVPILLDQLDDYADQFASGRLRDPLLRMLAHENLDAVPEAGRTLIFERCFLANHSKMIEPFAPYRRLYEMFRFAQHEGGQTLHYLSGQYLSDLLTWYHLSWTGESVRRSESLVASLMARGEGFTHDDRMQLLQLIGRLVSDIVPRYRRLAAGGRVELSTTPYCHPLAPLLLDFRSAREAQPDAPLPQAERYPGGRERVAWHLERAVDSHARRFGAPPRGVWPAEGALSGALVELLAEHGCGWAASGEGVLVHSLTSARLPAADRGDFLYRPYRARCAAGQPLCFFRDDRLSDLIGFEYQGWHGRDAAQHFVGQLEQILAAAPAGETPLVSVILDGENAWEFYPYNAYFFFTDLYGALEKHAAIRTTTFAAACDAAAGRTLRELPAIVAGSWVYGNLATWIGSAEKNRAWDLLCAAKDSYNLVVGSGRLSEDEARAAERQLAACESSDWFWWFGDYNPRAAVETFDRLFRAGLSNLYRLLKLPAPAQLAEPISHGGGTPESGGSMRRAA